MIDDTLEKVGDGVAIFSKSYCPYSKRAKMALLRKGILPVVVELDEREDGSDIQKELLDMTGQKTVPSVWVNGKYIGGSDDTVSGLKNPYGPFKDVLKASAKQMEKDEAKGMKKCGEADGLACRCYERKNCVWKGLWDRYVIN